MLDLGDTDRIPQLTMWDRLDRAAALHPWDTRQAKCHRTRRVKGDVKGYRTERGAWVWQGLVVCGSWSCPACGPRRARQVAAALGIVDQRHRETPEHDTWMLSLTLPHLLDDLVGVTTERLYNAHAAFLRSKEWRAFVERFDVVGHVRVLDGAFGGRNGAHPHFHIALYPRRAVYAGHVFRARADDERPEEYRIARSIAEGHHRLEALLAITRAHDLEERPISTFSKEERQVILDGFHQLLWPAWRAALIAAGVDRVVGENALKLSPAEDAAAYFTAWGLADEVGGSPLKATSHLRLLDAYALGYDEAGGEYRAWCAATLGRQWVTGMADLVRKLGITDDDIDGYITEMRRLRDVAALDRGEELRIVRPLYVAIPSLLYPAALSLGWAAVTSLLDAADLDGRQPLDELVSALRDESLRLDLLRTRKRAAELSGVVT